MERVSNKSDIKQYSEIITNNKKTIIKTTLSLTILVLLLFLIYPKPYESFSVIQVGKIDKFEYTPTEAKTIIESYEVLKPIVDEYNPKIDVKEFKEKHLNVEIIKDSLGFQVESTPYVKIITTEKDAETAKTLNSKIIESFLSQVSPNYELNLNVLTNELSEIKQNIEKINSDISEIEMEIKRLGDNSLTGETTSKITILRALLSEKRTALSEERILKSEIEKTLVGKKEFKIISSPEVPKNHSGPGTLLVLIITLIISFCLSLMYILIKERP